MPSPSSESKSSVFISYAREDKEFAEQFKEILSEHGIQVWLDEAELRPLEKWDQEIKNAILSHDYLIFLASRSSTSSESFCHEEIKFAKQNNKIIIPINIDPKLSWLPDEINDINWINFSSIVTSQDDEKIQLRIQSDEFNRSFNLLLTALETDLDWVKLFTKLLQKSWEWDENERNDSYLLIGDELHLFLDAVTKYEDTKPEIIPLQKEFLDCSQQFEAEQLEKQRRIRKRLRIFAISVAALLIIVGVSLFLNWRQNIRKVANELQVQSRIQESNVDLSLLLNYQAYKMSESSEIEASLFENLLSNNQLAKSFDVGTNPVLATSGNMVLMSYCLERKEGNCKTSEMRLLDLATFQDIIKPYQIPGDVHNLLLHDEQNVIIVYTIENGTDEKMRSLKIDQGSVSPLQTMEINAWDMIFGNKENQLIISSKGRIDFWDYSTGNLLNPILVSDSNVTGLVLDGKSNILYSVDRYGILAWDLDNQQTTPKAFSGIFHSPGIYAALGDGITERGDSWVRMEGSEDVDWLVTQDRDGLIVWDTDTMEYIDYIIGDPLTVRAGQNKLAFIPRSSIVVFIGKNERIFFYDVITKETLATFAKRDLWDLKFSTDGRFLFISQASGKVEIFDRALANLLMTSDIRINPQKQLTDIDIIDETLLVGEVGALHIFDLQSSELNDSYRFDGCSRYAFSPIEKNTAVGCQDGSLKIIDSTNGELKLEMPSQDRENIVRIFYSPDGTFLIALYSNGLIAKYTTSDGHELWNYQLDSTILGLLHVAKMSPDGNYIVLPFSKISGEEVGYVAISSEKPEPKILRGLMEALPPLANVMGIGVSPDGRKIAFGSNSGIYIYDIDQDKVIQYIYPEITGTISLIEYVDEEKLAVVYLSGDLGEVSPITGYYLSEQHLVIYDSASGNQIGVISNPHSESITEIKSIDGFRLVTASLDGVIKVWDLSGNQLHKGVCSITERDFSRSEWEKYVGKIIPYEKACNDDYESRKIIDIDASTIQDINSLLGKGLEEDVEFYKAVKQIEPKDPAIIKIDETNEFDDIKAFSPAILQCRQTYGHTYSNIYMLYWPFMVEESVNSVINEIEIEANWKYPDGTIENFNMLEFMPPGKNSLLVFEDHLNGNALNGPKPGDFAELELLVTDVSGWNDPGSFIDQVEVEPLSAKAHANILMGDTNYPMHSMSLLIKNLSEKDISGINVGGIVYGAEEKPIDFFMKSYGSFTGEEIVIPAGESSIISAQSFTQSGRCVGYGSLTDPFKIEYYLGFNFNTEENVFPYGTITGEIVVE